MNLDPADALFELATRFAVATANAERLGVLADHTLTDRAGYAAEATKAGVQANERRHALRAALRDAFPATVHAVPDDELPVCTHIQGSVEVRATFDHGRQGVRVRYTPTQALAAGAALIAYAAIRDAGGTVTTLLGAFPPNPTNAEPTDENGGGRS